VFYAHRTPSRGRVLQYALRAEQLSSFFRQGLHAFVQNRTLVLYSISPGDKQNPFLLLTQGTVKKNPDPFAFENLYPPRAGQEEVTSEMP